MSGIATAARVAALRERAARARFAAAGVRSRAAADAVEVERERLATLAEPAAGDAADLSAWHSGAELRVRAVRTAQGDAEQADTDRVAALADWQELSRRRDALDEVLTRWRQDQQAKADAAAQRLMDDLGRRRKEWA